MGKPRSGIQVSIYNTPGNEQRGPTSCARVITRDTKRMNDICEYISECSSVTSADIKGVLEALTSYIGRELSYGYSVELEGLGHFSPSVKSKEVTDQKGNTKSSASIHGVNFRCSPRLKEMVKKNAPILVKRENLPKTGIEGRKAKMLSYLERNSYINLTDYAGLNNCTRYRMFFYLLRFCSFHSLYNEREGSRSCLGKLFVRGLLRVRLGYGIGEREDA